jgi:hypothetical protein
MFLEFTPIKGPLLQEKVNTLLGTIFLGTCALWAAIFILDVATGNNPIDKSIAAAIERSIIGEVVE